MTGKIITFANQKGGCGKTILSANIALDASNTGKKVLLVDAEKGGILVTHLEDRENDYFTVVNGNDRSFPKMLKQLKAMYDLIIIDTAGVELAIEGDNENLQATLNRKVILKSDLVVVPVTPDLETLYKSARLLNSLEDFIDESDERIKGLVVMNRITRGGKDTRELKSSIPTYTSIKRSDSSVYAAKPISYAYTNKQTIREVSPDSNSAIELKLLEKEIFETLNLEVK